MDQNQKTIITPEQAGQRLDIFCAGLVPGTSRAVLQRAIKTGHITVNGQPSKPRYLLKIDDIVVVPPSPRRSPAMDGAKAGLPLITLSILYEDEHVVAVNKPAGLLTHAADHAPHEPSVAGWFTQRYGESGGYVHRLDKDTSGVLVLAKTPEAYTDLREQFKKHIVRKEYLALVFGVPGGEDGRITRPLGRSRRNPSRRTVDESGKGAITEWSVEKKFAKYALMRVFPFTGRTHQIRVHLHHIGHPIVGDALYVFKRQRPPAGITRQLLHAEKITLRLPSGKKKTITAPLPSDFQSVLEKLTPAPQ